MTEPFSTVSCGMWQVSVRPKARDLGQSPLIAILADSASSHGQKGYVEGSCGLQGRHDDPQVRLQQNSSLAHGASTTGPRSGKVSSCTRDMRCPPLIRSAQHLHESGVLQLLLWSTTCIPLAKPDNAPEQAKPGASPPNIVACGQFSPSLASGYKL